MPVLITGYEEREAMGKRSELFRVFRCWMPNFGLDACTAEYQTRVVTDEEIAVVEAKSVQSAARQLRAALTKVPQRRRFINSFLLMVSSDREPPTKMGTTVLQNAYHLWGTGPRHEDARTIAQLPIFVWYGSLCTVTLPQAAEDASAAPTLTEEAE